jgi:cell division protein FtsW
MPKSKNDILLVIAVTLLLITGIIMVFSASALMAHERYGSLLYYSRKQILWGFVCILAIFIFSRINLKFLTLRGVPFTLVLIHIILLIGLFFWGDKVNGARRWYNLGIGSFQPSELVKLALIIYFADIFSRKADLLHDWKKGLMPHLVLLSLVLIPILLEPDLGTVIMITLIVSTMVLLSNVRMKHILAGIFLTLPVLMVKVRSSSFQLDRLTSWLANISNPLGSGYQIKQSLIGLGSGGLIGNGIGTSKQKFYFLPESHTDFVYAIVGEETGFIGTTMVLLLFLLILWRGISIAKQANNPFLQYTAIGLTMSLVLYALINAAVVTMLIPTTGVPMPFLSYGGSSLLSAGIAVGILINISRNAQQPFFEYGYNRVHSKLPDTQRTFTMARES